MDNNREKLSRITTLPAWASSDWNDNGDVIMGYEVSVHRNINNHKFPRVMSAGEAEQTDAIVMEAVKGIVDGPVIGLFSVGEGEKAFLHERRMIGQPPISFTTFSHLTFDSDEKVAIASNENDHLKIRIIGDDISATCVKALKIESMLDIEPAIVNGKYATADVSLYGSGVYVGVMLHLPATHLSGASVMTALKLASSGFDSRELFLNEASPFMLEIGFVSPTLEEISEYSSTLKSIAASLFETEVDRRSRFESGRGADLVGRALGTAKNARIISQREALMALSCCLAGIDTSLCRGIDANELKEGMVASMDGHMAISTGTERKSCLDEARATVIRSAFKSGVKA